MKWIAIMGLLAAGPLHEMDESQLDTYLGKVAASERPFAQRLVDAARGALGTTYHDGPLGEGAHGQYDKDPLVDFTRADCVTYVEQSLAVATASSYDEMFANLQKIRYQDGKTDYEHRNHFMISDWVGTNPFCEDVSTDLGVETKSVTRTISRAEFFERVNAPGLGKETPDQGVTIHVVPPAATTDAEQSLPSPSLVVFVGKVDWLFALHCGLYIRDENGDGKLYHASSKAGEVAAVDLGDYMNEQAGRYIGFTAYRLHEPDIE